jgi:hypothetical protein
VCTRVRDIVHGVPGPDLWCRGVHIPGVVGPHKTILPRMVGGISQTVHRIENTLTHGGGGTAGPAMSAECVAVCLSVSNIKD